MTVLLCLMMIQLWNQPSVRMLGFGRHFEGFIPDPITDLMWNPASLKEFGSGYEDTFNSLQIYSIMQIMGDIDSTVYPDHIKSIFLRTAEPLALLVFYPKIGLGFRSGAFVRYDERNYSDIEQHLYGQDGFFGALNLGRFVKIGGEFNWSWNNQPDEFYVTVWDSINDEYSTTVSHWELSKEVGAGILMSDNGIWRLSLSARKNWEKNMFYGHRILWPDDWQQEWNERREYLRSFVKLEINVHPLKVVLKYDYCDDVLVYRRYYEPEDSSIFEFSSYRPGIAVLYLPHTDIIVSGGFLHDYHKYELHYVRSLIIPVAFETNLNARLKFRFGATCMYVHKDTYSWIVVSPSIEESYLKNDINLGVDFHLYDKMCLYLATQDLLNYKSWFFGFSFAL